VASRTARRTLVSGTLWGVVFGFYVFESAVGYASLYKTTASRDLMARTFGSNTAISALIGPAHQIQTVAGFTAWRTLSVLTIVGALWGLLTGTKVLRGEEEVGRWELYLAGRTTARWATAQALFGLGVGLLALWFVTAAISILVGRSSTVQISAGAMAYLAIALVSGTAMFMAVGALASQLAATRRQAAAYAGVALGVAYALRMVADSGVGLSWLAWVSPLGWVEELQPLTAPHPLALAVIFAFTGILSGFATHLAGIRDLGASTLSDTDRMRPRSALLSGATGLALRLNRSTVLAWGVGVTAGALLLGSIAKAAGTSLQGTTGAQKILGRLGANGTGGAVDYLAVAFLIIAVLVAFVAANQVNAMRSEEADGRLEHLLVRPVGRWSWLTGRIASAVAAVLLLAALAGVATWATAVPSGVTLSLASLLDAGANVLPPALFVLGVGICTLGVAPRATSTVLYGLIGWSFLVDLIGDVINANHWLLDTSLFHQMTAAPAHHPDWGTNAVLIFLGATFATCGGLVFARRDLVGS
jgi:ABC-2 type transport system permease protein